MHFWIKQMEKYIKNDRSHVSRCWRRELQIWKEGTLKQTLQSSFVIEGQYELIWQSIIFYKLEFYFIYFHKVSVSLFT